MTDELNPTPMPAATAIASSSAGSAEPSPTGTVSWLGSEREHDWFDRPANVITWAVELGLIDGDVAGLLWHGLEHEPPHAVDELRKVRGARAALRAVLSPLAHGDRPAVSAVEQFNQLLRRMRPRQVVDPRTLLWSWEQPTRLTEVMAPVIDNAAHVLTETDHTRLGHCPACGWLFSDTSRNRSRRWCDMADCGSRDKALRYYHRTRARA